MERDEYSEVIDECSKALEIAYKGDGYKDDDKMVSILDIYYKAIYTEVYEVLSEDNSEEAEERLREIIAKNVIGYADTQKGENYRGALGIIKSKMKYLVKNDEGIGIKAKYCELYDNFMAIAAYRSYKHYCLYMERPCFGISLWADTLNVFSGYMYYVGRMVLDGEYHFIEKQCPTGYGKSLSDAFMTSWIFGIDKDNDILKVCGNDKFTDDCFQNVVDKLMLNPHYAKVFPYYAQFECQRNQMFSYCATKELKCAITGSKKSTNLRIVTKLSDVNGVRAKYLMLDDITQRKDMNNLTAHEKDIHAFTHEWFERNYNRENFFIIASGTTYSQFDILSHLFREMGGERAVQSPINKYTKLSVSDYIVPKGKSVFVSIPLLDYDTDKSTYPKKISTASAKEKRRKHPDEFAAMDQQRPFPPKGTPFYFTKLRSYMSLPQIGECGRQSTCLAALDPKRRGSDYLSMPIFFKADDPDRMGDEDKEDVYFLVDWLYDNRPMEECLPLIASKLKQHKVTHLYAERNTEECINHLIEMELDKLHYDGCVIDEVYSTANKETRIMGAEGTIKSRMIFPDYQMYSTSTDIGKALMNVYNYTYDRKMKHDDAPDSLSLFAYKYIIDSSEEYASISIFSR